MTAGRMIWYFLPEKRIYRVRATSLTKYFVWADVVTFLVQASGGSLLSSDDPKVMKVGQNVYMAGTGLQQLFIVLFTILMARFHVRMKEVEQSGYNSRQGVSWQRLLYTIYAVLVLITVSVYWMPFLRVLSHLISLATASNLLPTGRIRGRDKSRQPCYEKRVLRPDAGRSSDAHCIGLTCCYPPGDGAYWPRKRISKAD